MPERIQDSAVIEFKTEVDLVAEINKADPTALETTLKRTHPTYDKLSPLWQIMADAAYDQIDTDEAKKHYLPQASAETDDNYAKRISLSHFIPESPNLLSRFLGIIFAKSPTRTIDANKTPRAAERITRFWDSAGPNGDHVDLVMQKAAEVALVHGSADVFLDHPAGLLTEIPYAIVYPPTARLDWSNHPDGLYSWVKYFESSRWAPAHRGTTGTIDAYRIIYPHEAALTTVIRIPDRLSQVHSHIPVPLTFRDTDGLSIPIRSLYWRQRNDATGTPWIKPIARSDLIAFAMESDLQNDIYMHSHPTLLLSLHVDPATGKPKITHATVGSGEPLHLDPGTKERNPEKAQYLVPPDAALAIQARLIDEHRLKAHRLASNEDTQQTSKSIMPKSGPAIQAVHKLSTIGLKRMTKALEELDWQISALVGNEDSDSPEDLAGSLEITYSTQFDQRDTRELAETMDLAIQTGSQTLANHYASRIAGNLIADGLSAETVSKINQEIKTHRIKQSK